MGSSPRHPSTVPEHFAAYARWYLGRYLPEDFADELADEGDREALADNGWLAPLDRLTPLHPARIAELFKRFGQLPDAYTALLRHVGVGPFYVADEDEPAELRLLAPDELDEARATFLSWLDEPLRVHVSRAFTVDVERALPFMTRGDCPSGNFALLARQHDGDDRVFVWFHDEPAYFGDPRPLHEFFAWFFARSRERNALIL